MEKDYHELEDVLNDLESIMGEQMYIVYILRTAYKLSFDKIADIIKISRESVRRMYNESILIVNEYLGDEKDEKKQIS